MTPTTTLTAPTNVRPATPRQPLRRARLAIYAGPSDPPVVEDLDGDDSWLLEALFDRTVALSSVPPLALREVIENLVHADFDGACVSIFDGGTRVRVADCGPGIADKSRACEPGYSTACERARTIVRGVGSGLPVAAAVMRGAGGEITLDDNLRGGTVITLTAPALPTPVREVTAITDTARRLLALLVEVAPAAPAALAQELDMGLNECGRELVVLEHRGLVARDGDGRRQLTPSGTDLLTTLF